MSSPWTNTEIATFTQLWREGLSTEDCAKALGRSYQSVEKARARFGLPPRKGRDSYGWTAGAKLGRPKITKPLHCKDGPVVGEHSRAMKRETNHQARMWATLLARAS